MKRRVVITGAGIVSAVGTGVERFWRSCLRGDSVVAPIPDEWHRYADLRSRLWSPLPQIDGSQWGISRTERLQLDPGSVNALVAAHDALTNANYELVPNLENSRGLQLSNEDAARVGVFLGTGIGGAYTFLHNHVYHLHERAAARLKKYIEQCLDTSDRSSMEAILASMAHGSRYHPFVVSMLMPNANSAALGIKFSIIGPNVTFCVACASGTVAIGNAYRSIRDGLVDVALSGGCEYLNDDHGHIFRGFDVAGTLVRDCVDAERANCPFDKKHSGFLFSQGAAAVLVLEELEHAQSRKAPVIAELIGYAETFDACSMMSLAPGGGQIERMLRAALADAEVSNREVDYVNAHGTGTKNNDEAEAELIDRVFGSSVLVNSTKSILGHTIGASGAVEALVTALSLRDQTTHACKNLDAPIRSLNFVRTVEHYHIRVGLSQSFAFGGHNAALVLRRFA